MTTMDRFFSGEWRDYGEQFRVFRAIIRREPVATFTNEDDVLAFFVAHACEECVESAAGMVETGCCFWKVDGQGIEP